MGHKKQTTVHHRPSYRSCTIIKTIQQHCNAVNISIAAVQIKHYINGSGEWQMKITILHLFIIALYDILISGETRQSIRFLSPYITIVS